MQISRLEEVLESAPGHMSGTFAMIFACEAEAHSEYFILGCLQNSHTRTPNASVGREVCCPKGRWFKSQGHFFLLVPTVLLLAMSSHGWSGLMLLASGYPFLLSLPPALIVDVRRGARNLKEWKYPDCYCCVVFRRGLIRCTLLRGTRATPSFLFVDKCDCEAGVLLSRLCSDY